NGARVESGGGAAAAGEFPVIAPGLAGQRNRHVWHLASAAGEVFFRQVARRNMLGEVVDSFDYGPGVLAEEHVFVPRQHRDGHQSPVCLLAPALDWAREATALHLFDAHNLAAGPLAVAQLEYALPLGLHGWFSPALPA
ncbi:MAG: carotenoid oxygenase family protein, partial [Gammaproteobacteria bacterium]|nr:carotenoid oxygenase family protein [Gammaproteobacteria bacterium]